MKISLSQLLIISPQLRPFSFLPTEHPLAIFQFYLPGKKTYCKTSGSTSIVKSSSRMSVSSPQLATVSHTVLTLKFACFWLVFNEISCLEPHKKLT
jgi:hypothetical protein